MGVGAGPNKANNGGAKQDEFYPMWCACVIFKVHSYSALFAVRYGTLSESS